MHRGQYFAGKFTKNSFYDWNKSLTSALSFCSDLRPSSLEKGQETLRLRVYACYAWGGPLLVAGLAALLDHLPPQPQYTFLRPRFGEKMCWFYGEFLWLLFLFSVFLFYPVYYSYFIRPIKPLLIEITTA